MSVVARTGRHKQRYQDHLRLVAGCIPYKIDKKAEEEECVLVLMISTPNRKDLVFPKGGWEDDESVDEAACREALEEAGVKGIIGENPIGEWEFRSKSSEKMSSCGSVGGCKGYMFALQVTQELDHWPGHSLYYRKWVRIEEAFKVCRYEWMRDALKAFLNQQILISSTNSSYYMGNSSTCFPSPHHSTLLSSPPNLLEL